MYLVDTGAALSLLPFRSSQPSSGPKLCNANRKPISSWKFNEKTLQFGKHTFKNLFLCADFSQAIIGLGFLHANLITVDAVSPPNPLFSTPVFLPTVPLPVSSVSTHARDILSILNNSPSVTNPPSTSWPSPKHKTVHSIHTSGPPVFARIKIPV
jgi:hypothetical protein